MASTARLAAGSRPASGLRFRYATDKAANGQGWYVDDIAVGTFSGAVDAPGDWTTSASDGWLFTTGQQQNDWTADAVAPFAKAQARGIGVVPVLGVAGLGVSGSTYVDAQYQKSLKVYGVVYNRPQGTFDSTGILSLLKGSDECLSRPA